MRASGPRPRRGAASAWGFSAPARDARDGLWHAFSTVACGTAGVVGDGGGESFIAHLTAAREEGPFSLLRMFSPQTTFGPMSAVAADGTFVLIFRVNVLLDNATVCAGAAPAPSPALPASADVPAADLVSGDPEVGTSIWVAWSRGGPAGPFDVARVNITGAGEVHKSNPSIAQLADGRWLMAYRYNPPGGSLNAIAVADDFRGPYENTANVTVADGAHGGDEDPFGFVLPASPTIAHMLYHNRQYGYHAWGPINGSAPWRVGNTSHAFTLSVPLDDGSVLALGRRERPALRFDASGAPVALINGVQEGGRAGQCDSFVQPLRAAAAGAAY